MTTKKTDTKAATKTESKTDSKADAHADEKDVVQEGREKVEAERSEKNNTMAYPVDRSIFNHPTTGELNPAYQVETD